METLKNRNADITRPIFSSFTALHGQTDFADSPRMIFWQNHGNLALSHRMLRSNVMAIWRSQIAQDTLLCMGKAEYQETRNQKPETRNQKPETRNQKPETRNQKPETRNQVDYATRRNLV